jgi:Reverse transcriptase (RNA-dependent DNA polymerase)
MVDIKAIIDELPKNPSEALIQLDTILGNEIFRKLFSIDKKQKDPVYGIHIKSLDDGKGKSYSQPTFPKADYISYMKSVGKSRQPKPLPNYSPLFKLWDKEWMRFTHEDILSAIENKDTKDHYGANFLVLRSLIDLEPKLLDFMVDCYNRLSCEELCPEWSNCGLVPAHKGGDTSIPNNFRPLTVLPLVVRIWDSVISKKLGELLKKYGVIDTLVQRGVLSGVGGLTQNLLDVNRAMCSMSNDESCFFIDITNAYGSVNYGLLCHILREYNFSPALTEYIKTYYMNAYASYDGQIFRWENGLYQGSGLSNILFLIYMDYALKNAITDLKMMRIIDFGFDLQKKTRAFVDDLVMFLPKASCGPAIEFIQMLFSRFYGLEINKKKTYFIMNDEKIRELVIGDISFQRVDINFRYLGLRLMCFQDFLTNYREIIRSYLEEIETFDIDRKYKLYLYYRRVFPRINRTLKCYYAIHGRTTGLDEIMKVIGYFIYRWTGTFSSAYLVKHIQYIASVELPESDVVNFQTLFGLENPMDDDDFCEKMTKCSDDMDPYL